MKVEGLAFAGVGTADPAGTARFFADALGVEVRVEGDVHLLALPDGSTVAFVPPAFVQPPSDTVLGFLVDDVEAATAELAEMGVHPDGGLQSGYGFRYRHFGAPGGRRFELLDRCAG